MTEFETQAFVICDVTNGPYGWDIHLGPEDDDPWVSVKRDEWPKPQIGQIATVTLPRVTSIEDPEDAWEPREPLTDATGCDV